MEITCAECGFDATAMTTTAVASRLTELAPAYRRQIAGWPEAAIRRPAAGRAWSAAEYVGHVGDAIGYHGWLIQRVLKGQLAQARSADADPDEAVAASDYAHADVGALLDRLEAQAVRLTSRIGSLTDDELDTTFSIDGRELDVRFLTRSALHETFHHLLDVRAIGDASHPES